MFQKLLIANRGEIACRVVRTARRMGIATVAVYSDADARALHVAEADEALRIGAAPAAESYLNIAAIIDAAKSAKADAIHPGYGFLSENAAFADACEAAGIVFVGPPAQAMRIMGLKDEAKRVMAAAGVPIAPGYQGGSQDAKLLAAEARKIGFPLLIKAVAGGGGKGIRRVDSAGEFAAALAAAQGEGQSSFGDGRVLLEKYIATARHIEMQVFADSHGNIVHLFERDCSLQRRHQKVIEEAPAPGMTPELRAAMGKAAIEAARAVGYRGAGTVEFLVDASEGLRADRFYFMEMNTRLQVEHPVTEAITGLDLVEWQLRVAAGERLPLGQEEIAINGHAFEARIYAEDPAHDFRPAPGRIEGIRFPIDEARIDTSVQAGDEITPHYDPMIAKLIVHGADREAALAKLTRALDASLVSGITTNIAFLSRLSADADVAAGRVDTGLIGRAMTALAEEAPPTQNAVAIAALAHLDLLTAPEGSDPWATLTGWRAWGAAERTLPLRWSGGTVEPRIRVLGRRRFEVLTSAGVVTIAVTAEGIELDGQPIAPIVSAYHGGIDILVGPGERAGFKTGAASGSEAGLDGNAVSIVSPMPGTLKSVAVSVGATVAKGDRLAVVEAMKTEYALNAPRDGIVAEVLAAAGDSVAAGAVIVKLRTD